MKISKENLKFYQDNGFLIVKDIINKNHVKDIYSTILNVFKKYNKNNLEINFDNNPWDNHLFHDSIINFRSENPKLFSAIYDTMQTSLSLQSLFFNEKLIDIAAILLNEEKNNLSATGHMLRMDVPLDKRNVLNWHQDSFYYKQNLEGKNGLVCWVPLINVNAENGTIKILPSSHKLGKLKNISSNKEDHTSSEQFIIPKEYINMFKETDLVSYLGDAIYFSMDIIHRSGNNTSKLVRFATTVRYHRMLTDDFLPGLLSYTPNEYINDLLTKKKE